MSGAMRLVRPLRRCHAAMGRLSALVAGIFLLAAGLPADPAAAAEGKWIYWSDYGNGTISRVRPDGTAAETLLPEVPTPLGLAIDDAAGKLYWVEAGTRKIRRANLDGSAAEDVVATGAGTPYALAVDVEGGKVYWSEYPGGDGLQRANLDGTGVETILPGAGPGGLALDVDAGLLYFADYWGGQVGRVGLDGSGVEVLAASRPNPNHVALDLAAGRLFWSEGVFVGRVNAADLDGANAVTVVNGESSPAGLALDGGEGILYWAAESGHAIRRAATDGTGLATLVAASSRPLGVAIAGATPVDESPPVIDVPEEVVAEATNSAGAVVSFQVAATDDEDPQPLVDCAPPSGSQFALGETLVTCEATDAAGNRSEATFPVRVLDRLAPSITTPAMPPFEATGPGGATVAYAVEVRDTVDPAPGLLCEPASGSLFALGTTTVLCAAIDASGNLSDASFVVRVEVSWSGVLQPVNADGSSVFKLGSTVPVKFRLAGDSAAISDLGARLYATKLSDGVVGTEVEATSTGAADSGNRFRYDAESGQYVFNWGTKPLTAGTYQLRIDTGDGVLRTVLVSLR